MGKSQQTYPSGSRSYTLYALLQTIIPILARTSPLPAPSTTSTRPITTTQEPETAQTQGIGNRIGQDLGCTSSYVSGESEQFERRMVLMAVLP
jgi:hypothetical protein